MSGEMFNFWSSRGGDDVIGVRRVFAGRAGSLHALGTLVVRGRLLEAAGGMRSVDSCVRVPGGGPPSGVVVHRLVGLVAMLASLVLAGSVEPVSSSAAAACANESLRRGPSVALPDCRAYEQVSPVEKGGYDGISRLPTIQYPAQSSANGQAVAYQGNGPLSGAVGSWYPDSRVSYRGETSWTTTDSTFPTPSATLTGPAPAGYDFSEDLSQVVVKVPQQPLSEDMPSGTEGLYNLFLRHPDGTYSLINSVAPTTFPPGGCETCFRILDLPSFAGGSSDFSHILFETDDILEGTGALAGFPNGNLYENSGGSMRLVGVLPDGTAAVNGAAPGAGGALLSGILYSSLSSTSWLRVEHAMSEDGSKVVFRAVADEGGPDPAQSGMDEVFDRIEGQSTIELSTPASGSAPANATPEPAQFWAASTNGSLVFFTSSAELTTQSNTGESNSGSDLYRYEVPPDGNPAHGHLTDLTVDASPGDAATGADVQGVVGTSHDGAYVYFVAMGELVEGQGVDGQPNLYVAHEDPESHANELRYIATLAPEDSKDWTATPAELQAYVTPDGIHLAFMSRNSLTGYDNHDASTGGTDSQVFEYSTASGTLECASCNPTGQQPTGAAFLGSSLEHLASTPFHQPRVMSDDGNRLFFSSPDELAAGANGTRVKIYEHERTGTGTCIGEASCIFLISSGANSTDDIFLDASRDGSNVFFATLSQLTGTDKDTLGDVYDARVGGGFVEPVAPAECSNDCQTPQGAPAVAELASGFAGASGNLLPPSRGPSVTNAQRLAKALRACPRKPRARRIRCVARARKRYGARAVVHRNAATRRGGHS
jgi:hypothetical protein